MIGSSGGSATRISHPATRRFSNMKRAVGIKRETVCVKNGANGAARDKEMTKKDSNDFQYKLKQQDNIVKDFYNNELKNKKLTDEDKRKFVSDLFAGRKLDADHFNKKQWVESHDQNITKDVWKPYKEYADKDGENVMKAQLAQGTISTRPHPKLDPNHESTLALAPHLRLQYALTEELTKKVVDDVDEIERSTTAAPSDAPEDNEKSKQAVMTVRKAHNSFNNSLIEFKVELGKYEGNPYHVYSYGVERRGDGETGVGCVCVCGGGGASLVDVTTRLTESRSEQI